MLVQQQLRLHYQSPIEDDQIPEANGSIMVTLAEPDSKTGVYLVASGDAATARNYCH